jgi:hypothetical protein
LSGLLSDKRFSKVLSSEFFVSISLIETGKTLSIFSSTSLGSSLVVNNASVFKLLLITVLFLNNAAGRI